MEPTSPPTAALAILCPNAWLGEEAGAEDYSICFLPNDHSVLPRTQLSAADRALARSNQADEVFLGLRVAALRCAFESVGVMVAANPPPSFARRELQKILQREGPMAFHAFLDDWGIRLRPSELIEISWFLRSVHEEHIFLAPVPDAAEATWAQGFWASPTRLLQLYERQELDLTWAEWYLLHELRSELPQFHGLPELASKKSCLWSARALPLAPLPNALLLPGDEEHPDCPGRPGERHRLHLKENSQLVQRLERSERSERKELRAQSSRL
ncbi:unnamed protein product [Durusdinium trenchii]|uniref:Uncharacterized protein n=1 Tax=Durusdinium trenchii TaxID=1381693 RepID=A0ABP0JF55_9DINO